MVIWERSGKSYYATIAAPLVVGDRSPLRSRPRPRIRLTLSALPAPAGQRPRPCAFRFGPLPTGARRNAGSHQPEAWTVYHPAMIRWGRQTSASALRLTGRAARSELEIARFAPRGPLHLVLCRTRLTVVMTVQGVTPLSSGRGKYRARARPSRSLSSHQTTC